MANLAPDDGGKGGDDGKDKEDPEERMIRMVNAAVSSQIGRKLESAVSSAVESAIAPVLAKLTKEPDDKGGKDKSADPAMASMQAQIEALTNQIAEKDSTAAAATKQHREEQLVAQIRESLTQSGVKKELMDGAVATVRTKMQINEETGAVTYRKQNQGWHEDISIEAGLKDWTDSDTGKAHLAPVQAGGAGTSPQTGGGAGGLPALNPATLPQDPEARSRVVKAHKIAKAKQDLRHHTTELMSGGRISLSGDQ